MGILRHHRRLGAAALISLLLWMGMAPAFAQEGDRYEADDQPIKLYEQKIKAGLVYNFLKFTIWPESMLSSPKNNLRVCLYGGDAFDGYLYPLEGRTAQQHTITILQVDNLDALKNCHVAFIHRSENDKLDQILAVLKGKSILTISDIRQFAQRGGMVEFSTQKDQRIHLYINKALVENSGLTVQDRLLKLTELVH
jgi:hypothetical protein